jgi:C1A family cysteine protease
VDWEEYFAPVGSQYGLASSPANAVAGLVEYFERRAHGRALDLSCLFLYKMARVLLHRQGDTGVPLRATLKALTRFGVPPREYCPDDPSRFDDEPQPFLFAYARDYQSLLYLRLDAVSSLPEEILLVLKAFVAAGLPVAFGFPVFDSLGCHPDIPFPSCFDALVGGQAVVALGYDDSRRIRSERGALRVRNSWGPEWGENGYGWLPYRYVIDRLACDFWTLLRPDWLEAGGFLPLL